MAKLFESYNLFGFLFKDRKQEQEPLSFAPPQNDDGAVVVEQGGAFSTVVDLDGIVKNEIELITKYREMASRPEVEGAISEIVNESIVTEEQKAPISLVTDKLNYSDDIVEKIQEEFENVLNLLDFNNEGQDIFRQWYTDGRLYYHIIIDPRNPRDGIQELRPIDPRRIKPVIETESYVSQEGVPMQIEKQRYYVYNQFGTDATTTTTGVKIAWDSICYIHSGIRETNNTMILGYLHKALKSSNMLSMVEDATVIYRLSRAPERRVFYIDVGNLPKQKAEQYLKDIMSKYRNKMVYDACLAMDTKIPLLDGRTLTLAEISEEFCKGERLWAYSADPITGKLKPGLITSAGVTRKSAKVVRITFDNEKSVVCTLDHKFPVWDRGDVEAQNLKVGDSMIPFYTKETPIAGNHTRKHAKYQQIFDNSSKKWTFTHRLVSNWKDTVGILNELVFNPENSDKPKQTVHHRNYNRMDNSPENLIRMNGVDHLEFHHELARLGIGTIDPIRKQEIGRKVGLIIGPRMVAEHKGIHGLTSEQTLENSHLGSRALRLKLSSDENFHRRFCLAIKNGLNTVSFQDGASQRGRNLPHEHFIEMNKKANEIRWNQLEAHEKWSRQQSVEYPESLLEAVLQCASLNLSTKETLESLKTIDLAEWKMLNDKKTIRGKGKTTFEKIKYNDLTRISKLHGFSGFKNLRDSFQYRNHKVINIEYLEETMDVGTLSIDRNELYHDYHTFALDCGVFTKNSTGEIREDKKFLSFMEDYWLPRREGGRGTEITTLPGGENLGEMADVEYFKEKLYQSLNVPVGRLKSDSGFNLGRTAEISRDEVKFGKFIYRIRNRFTQLFDDLLSTQLMLKGIITKEDWSTIRTKVFYSFLKDTYFSEMKNLEIIQNRMAVAEQCIQFVGKYFSHEYLRRGILMQTDEEFKQLDAQMMKEKNDPRYQAIEAMTTGMMPGMGGGMDPSMGGDPSMMAGQDPNAMGGMPPGMGGGTGGDGMGPGGSSGMPGQDQEDDDEEGDDNEGSTDQTPPQSASASEDDEDESAPLDPDDLPTERVTRNIEQLFRR